MLDRQVDNESRAGIRFALHLDKAPVIVHHSVNHGQSETGAFAALLRGKKWLEDMRLHLPAHAASGVAHADAGIILRAGAGERFGQLRARRNRCLERERPAVFHRVARIHAEIQQHLVNLAAIGGDQGKVRLQAQLEVDHFRERRLQHFFQLTHERIQIEGGKSRLRLARRGQQLLHEGRPALDRFLDDFGGAGRLRLWSPGSRADSCILE